MKRSFAFLLLALSAMMTKAASATTWYVRPDGGTRYSSAMPNGQCNGLSDAKYPGSGVNQDCAFGDFRFLYQDGSYAANDGTSNFAAPHWGWVIAGGDTVIIRGSIGSGVSYRVGWNNPNNAYDDAAGLRFGLSGDPYGSLPPTPPSGTALRPTRILGENYASCSAATAKTQLHGGYGLSVVLQMAGASYVDVECLDITDFSACGKANQQTGCNKDIGSLSDFADTGIYWDTNSTHDTLKNVHIHGMARNGMSGSTGDGVVLSGIDMIGNASSGWNADAGNGVTGKGSLLVQNFNISWNGCAEQYPIKDALPYQDCTDDNSGGYGDGFGTATVAATSPWNVHFDQGTVSYNTQDGLDALHLIGSGSSMTITRVLAYGNMGEQLKNGGENGIIENSVIMGNCYAMQNAIPGTPSGYNARLSDFCRAANNGVLITTAKNANTIYRNNTLISGNAVGILLQCDQTEGACDGTSKVDIRNNIFVGYVGPNLSDFPQPIYLDQGPNNSQFPTNINPFMNAGSYNSNNITYHGKSNWVCPALGLNEKNAICSDPALKDETERVYGFNDVTPLQGSQAIGTGATIAGVTLDFNGLLRANPTSRGAIDPDATGTVSTPVTTPTAPTADPTPTTPTTVAPTTPTTTTPATPAVTTITTMTTLSATKGPSLDNPAILTATVRALNSTKTPHGKVTIYTDNNVVVGSANLVNGVARWTMPSAFATESVHAVYAGKNKFLPSTSSVLVGSSIVKAFWGK